jgi:hypothetical protein
MGYMQHNWYHLQYIFYQDNPKIVNQQYSLLLEYLNMYVRRNHTFALEYK